MLRRNDVQRLAGYEGIAKHGKSKVKERMCDEMLYSATMRELLPEARYAVEPLYAAAYNGDVDAIRSLSKADTNPNIKHPNSGYTALHVAVFHCKLDAVAALLSYFRGRIALNVQDKKGDTALHLASRLGFVEITSAICNEDSCDPLLVKNNDGMYPIDVVRSHKVWQMIKVCQTRNDLLEELHALKKH